MKTKQVILSCVIVLFCTIVSIAQNPVSTLEHNGTTQVFYGQGSFVDAYNASANGDHIYLSTGFFTPPPSIEKGIKIIGAGHFPDSASVAKRTFILGGLRVDHGADSLQMDGLYINGDILYDYYAGSSSINHVKVIRCRIGNVIFNSYSLAASKNNCSFEECFIEGGINFGNNGNNFCVRHCIISGFTGIIHYTTATIGNISGNALIDGNIFITAPGSGCSGIYFYGIYGSLIQNNIFLNCSLFSTSAGNSFKNNLFIANTVDFTNNYHSNNFINIPQADIFVNQTGNAIDYSHDYHLKNPELYLGTDGTQVGIYGGTTPFKEKGAPSNPQVIKKSIADQTDAEGNLPINFTVKAQDN